jgi:hypothetical protein
VLRRAPGVKDRPRQGNCSSPVVANSFHGTAGHCFLAGGELGFAFRLLADVRVCVLERSKEVVGSGIAAHVAVDAGRIDVEGASNVFLDSVV